MLAEVVQVPPIIGTPYAALNPIIEETDPGLTGLPSQEQSPHEQPKSREGQAAPSTSVHANDLDFRSISPNRALEVAVEMAVSYGKAVNNLDRHYELGQAILRAREVEMPAMQVMQHIANKSGLRISSLNFDMRFAKKYSADDIPKLKAGKFQLSWHMMIKLLSKNPSEVIEAYLASGNWEGMCSALHIEPRSSGGRQAAQDQQAVEALQKELAKANKRVQELEDDRKGYEMHLIRLKWLIKNTFEGSVWITPVIDAIDAGEGWAHER